MAGIAHVYGVVEQELFESLDVELGIVLEPQCRRPCHYRRGKGSPIRALWPVSETRGPIGSREVRLSAPIGGGALAGVGRCERIAPLEVVSEDRRNRHRAVGARGIRHAGRSHCVLEVVVGAEEGELESRGGTVIAKHHYSVRSLQRVVIEAHCFRWLLKAVLKPPALSRDEPVAIQNVQIEIGDRVSILVPVEVEAYVAAIGEFVLFV